MQIILADIISLGKGLGFEFPFLPQLIQVLLLLQYSYLPHSFLISFNPTFNEMFQQVHILQKQLFGVSQLSLFYHIMQRIKLFFIQNSSIS